jgi:probable rRNA maturation factor
MPEITFLSKAIPFKLPHSRKTSHWLSLIASQEGKRIESLTYIFASDAFVGDLNERYLKHNAFTDILTFDYSEKGPIVGEIFISIPRVRENAMNFKQPFPHELRRVMAHGLLHILGYKDKTHGQIAQMRRKEEACLSLWSLSFT